MRPVLQYDDMFTLVEVVQVTIDIFRFTDDERTEYAVRTVLGAMGVPEVGTAVNFESIYIYEIIKKN